MRPISRRASKVLRFPRSIPVAAIIVAGILLGIVGCKKKESSSKPVDLSKLSDAELRFGVSPKRSAEVTYQPGVILVEHGAAAIRSANSEGLSVTIDASIPEAADMQPGKIVFLTSRAAGRILSSQRKGDDLTLFLGPVELTDIIKQAKMSTDQPLDLNSMVAYTAPDYPGAMIDAPELTQSVIPDQPSGLRTVAVSLISPSSARQPLRDTPRAPPGFPPVSSDPAVWTDHDIAAIRNLAMYGHIAAPARMTPISQTPSLPSVPQIPGASNLPKIPSPPPIPGPPKTLNLNDFNLLPFCCGGTGLKIDYNKNGLQFTAYAVIRLSSPSLHFDLDISDGKIRTAALRLNGAPGLTFEFNAGTSIDVNAAVDNLDKEVAVPVDFSVPISGLAVPFAATLRQTFLLKTAFSARKASLSATADYTFSGSFAMGYVNGSWTLGAPEGFTVKQSLVKTMQGVSVGVNGIVLAYQGKVIVGIGAFDFVTGPYIAYTTTVGFTRGSDALSGGPMGFSVCRSGTLAIDMAVGVGYAMPKVINDAINFFLRQLNFVEIPSSGGIDHKERLLTKQDASSPNCQ